MKKTSLSKKEILALPILTFFFEHLQSATETINEKTLYSLMENSLLKSRKDIWLGETVETLLKIEPIKLKTDCVLDGVSYGQKSHNLIKRFFTLHGFNDVKEFPLLKDLPNNKELANLSASLGKRSWDHVELDLQLKHPCMVVS